MRIPATSILFALFTVASMAQPHPPLELASRSGSTNRHAYYRTMIEEYTGAPGGEETWVIGLRGLGPDGKRHDSASNAAPYGDTMVVVRADGQVEELRGATHAGVSSSADCPWGVAQMRPGQYLASPLSGRNGETGWKIEGCEGSESLPVWLDRDYNGVICDREKQLDEHYGTVAQGLRIVNGRDPVRPQSSGAQTLPPGEFEKLVALVGPRQRFRYLLLDANHPVKEENRDLRSLSSPLSPADDFRFYEKIALAQGVAPGFSTLMVVLRGLSPDGARYDSQDNVGPYRDTFLVLSRHLDGSQQARAFLGSAHAGQAATTRSPGVYAGIAQLRPGLYFARSNSLYHGSWSWHIVNHEDDYEGNVPAWRDRDKDGYISPGEKVVAERNRVTANEILIHNGLDPEVGSSIGCVTLPPSSMGQFVEWVGEGSSFPFLLLDANSGVEP